MAALKPEKVIPLPDVGSLSNGVSLVALPYNTYIALCVRNNGVTLDTMEKSSVDPVRAARIDRNAAWCLDKHGAKALALALYAWATKREE